MTAPQDHALSATDERVKYVLDAWREDVCLDICTTGSMLTNVKASWLDPGIVAVRRHHDDVDHPSIFVLPQHIVQIALSTQER